MKLLIASGATSKFLYMNELAKAISKLGVECKLVKESDYSTGFPSKKISEWFSTNKKFKKLILEFKPDAIVVDRQLHFGADAIKSKIPLFVYLRGDYWTEMKLAKETICKNSLTHIIIWFRNKVAKKCFNGASIILPITKYLEKIVKENYPHKPTNVLSEGVDPSLWYPQKGMQLKHPCVGLLQGAVIWGKAKEMLVLENVLKSMPNVMFYWVGDGPYREKILPILEKYDNFKWLGSLKYPDKVREYLTEIDVYALFTGLETLGVTILEASLMKKPVVATNVGAISEIVKNKVTGYTIKENDAVEWIEKLTILLNNKNIADDMSLAGYTFVKDNFSWNKMAKELLNVINKYLNEHNIKK